MLPWSIGGGGGVRELPANAKLRKMQQMLHYPYFLGDPQTKGDKITSGCLTPTFSGAQKRAQMLCHPCILRDPQQRGQIQILKPTLGVPMIPLVSQSMGL